MPTRFVLALIALTCGGAVLAQPPPAGGDELICAIETTPELIGGLAALQAEVVYPEAARADRLEGRVVLQFVVQADGTVTDAVAVRSPDPRLTRAALDALARVRFEPGRQRGRPVAVRFALPVAFRLADADRQP